MHSIHAIAAALLMGGALAAQAADRDASFQPGELLSSNAEYREAWQDLVKDEERLPDWLINLLLQCSLDTIDYIERMITIYLFF